MRALIGMPKNRDQADPPLEKLLGDLQDSGNVEAWRAFLDQYAPTLIRVARQYAANEEEVQDGFLHVCEQLCANHCSKLQQYEPGRGTSFNTWLIAIVNNLCIDWHRGVYGRRTMPVAIRALPELERLTYRYRMEQSLDLETCLIALRRFYPELSRARLSEVLASLHAALTAKQRWKIIALAQRRPLSLEEQSAGLQPPNPGDGPGRNAETAQEREALQSALARLSPRHRLALRLRYEQELSLNDVASVAGLRDLHQARREIQAALSELQKHLAALGFTI